MERRTRPHAAWIGVVFSVLIALLGSLFLPLVRSYDPEPMPQGNGKVVVVGMVGVPWEAVDSRTPNLLALADTSVIANVSVRTFAPTTCAVGGWMTLNTGVRSAGIAEADESCVESAYVLVSNSSDSIDHLEVWDDIVASNAANRFDPQFGLFGEAINDEGRSLAAVGSGAAVAIADRNGNPRGPVIDVPMDGPVTSGAAAAYAGVANSDVVVIDLGSAHRDSTPSSQLEMTFVPPGGVSARTRASTARIDAELGHVLAEIDPGTTLIVTSLGDSDRHTARMQIYMQTVVGQDLSGLATSASTRQPGIIQNIDVQAAVFDALGLDVPTGAAGSAPTFLESDNGPAHLADVNERAIMTRAMVGLFYVLFLVGGLVVVVGATITIQAGRFNFWNAFSMVTASAMPAASFLVNIVPWWRVGRYSAATFTIGVTAIALAIAGMSMKLVQERTNAKLLHEEHGGEDSLSGLPSVAIAPAIVATVTAVTLGVDAALGSPLHSISVLGDQPQSGGRFYGMSNAPFAIWVVTLIFLTVAATRVVRSYRANVAVPLMVIVMAFIAIFVDGAPHIGADFGGPPALVLGFGVYLVLVIGVRLTVGRALVLGVAAGLSALAIAFLDWLRPPGSRTHLGQFMQSLIDGDGPKIILRKGEQLVTQVPWFGWLATIAVVAFIVMLWRWAKIYPLRRRPHFPELRAGAIAGLVTLLSAMAINDSGLVIPLVGGLYMVTLWGVAGLDGRENERYGRNLFEQARTDDEWSDSPI